MSLYEVFENLPMEKREKIFQAGVEVFAEKGYTGASTNEIVKKAGISKGILFHYFGNKRNLYLYILDKTLERVLTRFYSGEQAAPSDIFERIVATGMMKMKIAIEEPLVYKLMYATFVNTPESIMAEVQERYKKLYDIAVPMLYDGLDLSKIRSGIDPNKAVEVVLLFMEGLQARYIKAYKNMSPDQALLLLDKLWEDSMLYMDILKKGIYEA